MSPSPGPSGHLLPPGYSALFSTLLFAVALKSNFEAFEISRLATPLGSWVAVGTVASVIGGLALAFFRGREARLPWPELTFQTRDKILLVALLGVYLVVVVASLIVA